MTMRRGQGHELIAAARGVKRCKRCECKRVELDDGAVRWRTVDGRDSIDPPNCIPRSGEQARV